MTDLHVSSGQVIINQGDLGTEMYFVVDGTADILIDSLEMQPVASIYAGQFFGELALLQALPRNAYVRAATEMDLFVLTKQHLHAVIEAHPDLQQVLLRAVQMRSIPQKMQYVSQVSQV